MARFACVRFLLPAVAFALALGGAVQAAQDMGWLSVCGKCLSPSIIRQSGIGTANAAAEARISRADAQGYCDQWEPGDRGCVARELASEDAKQLFRATADCTRGRITAIDGETYAHAGLWDNSDIGGGRSRWRNASGQIVGRDNASNGLAISQQWEVLCPRGLVQATAPLPRPTAPPPPRGPAGPAPQARPPVAAASPIPGAAFQVGQRIEARFGRDWVKGQVVRLRPEGTQMSYEVVLVNGQRGILPSRMLRLSLP